MSSIDNAELSSDENFGSQYALQVAFQTMKERCQHLQSRLDAVEEENVHLRLECGKDTSAAVIHANESNEKSLVQALRDKIEDLTKQKSQLTHHIFMVAAENRQLWNRLTRLTRTNKNLGNQLTKISDTLKQHTSVQSCDVTSYNVKDVTNLVKNEQGDKSSQVVNHGNQEQSLEEISLKLINSIMLEKSELEQQYAQMVEMQNSEEVNLQYIGFTYPEDSDTDSLEQLKQHDVQLSQTKETLLAQQVRLKKAIQNLRKFKKGVFCRSCRQNANKKVCQIGTQFDSDDSLKEHGATQTSLLPLSNLVTEHSQSVENRDISDHICPLCGACFRNAPFTSLHEHVLHHFTGEESVNGSKMVQ
ncbi:protein spindle-F [Orussus abietinus]|uniref:protein spindle-F n=1 Tax=Orussus abietinus TaxID=222816 RepID=UPI000624F34C|nr:protein spindle-F [Orussus abietinus]